MYINDFNYVIVFKSTKSTIDISPLQFKPYHDKLGDVNSMHMLDEDLINVIPAMEYVLHLPRYSFDLLDCPEKEMMNWDGIAHRIVLIPDYGISYFIEYFNKTNSMPTLYIISDECSEKFYETCRKANSVLDVCKVSELTEAQLGIHWSYLICFVKSKGLKRVLSIEPTLLSGNHLQALPIVFWANQFDEKKKLLDELLKSNSNVEEICIKWKFKYSSIISTWNYFLENKIDTMQITEDKFNKAIKQNKKFNSSVIVSFPGQPKSLKESLISTSDFSEIDRQVIRIICVHKSIDKNGFHIELPLVPYDAFTILDELETHCTISKKYNNKFIWNSINKIGKIIGNALNQNQIRVCIHSRLSKE